MSTALVPVADLERMAAAFAKSQMFGAKTTEQAMALLLLAQAEGVHPAVAMRDFDVIQGRPAKKAEAMLRAFLAAGGSVTWAELTDTKVTATFSHPQGGKVEISWDMERATKAGLTSKDNWKKYPRQMLRSRVVSEGCRTVYPAATSGLYDTNEVSDFDHSPARGERGTHPSSSPTAPSSAPAERDMGYAEQEKVTPEQIEAINKALAENGVDRLALLMFAEIGDISELSAADGPKAIKWIEKQRKAAA